MRTSAAEPEAAGAVEPAAPPRPAHDLLAEDFGARADGTDNAGTDNAPAINAAIAAASARGGGEVRLAAGTYVIGSPIHLRSNVCLSGQGMEATRLRPTHASDAAVRIAGTGAGHRIHATCLRSLKIEGLARSPAPDAHGIYLQHATTDIILRDVEVRKVGGVAILLDGDVFFVRAHNLLVSEPRSGGIVIKGTGREGLDDTHPYGVGRSPWTNGNDFDHITFIGTKGADFRTIQILGPCAANRFTNVDLQSLNHSDGDAPIHVEGRWNVFSNVHTYDPTVRGTPLASIRLSGPTAVRNSFFSVSPFAASGWPLVQFDGGATGNTFWGLDRVGSPAAVYRADRSSTGNAIWFKDAAYGNGRGNERMPGSSRLLSYWSPGYGAKNLDMWQTLYQGDSTQVGAADLRAGRYVLARNDGPATVDSGTPVTFRLDLRMDRMARFLPVTSACTGHGRACQVVGAVAEDGCKVGADCMVQTYGAVRASSLDATAARPGDPVYASPSGGTPTLTRPDRGYPQLVGFVIQATDPAEILVAPNMAGVVAQERLGMQRATLAPTLRDQEFAVGLLSGAARLWWQDGPTQHAWTEGLRGAARLDFGPVPAGGCREQLLQVTGAALGAECAPGLPATLDAGLSGTCFVTAAGSVTVRLCNVTSSPVSPAAATFSARVFNP